MVAVVEVVEEEVVVVVTEVVRLVREALGEVARIAVKNLRFAFVGIVLVSPAAAHSSPAVDLTQAAELDVIHMRQTKPAAHLAVLPVALLTARKAGSVAGVPVTHVTSTTLVQRSPVGSHGSLHLERMHSADTAAVVYNPAAVADMLAAVA